MTLDYFTVMPTLARVSWRAALWWGRRRGDLRFWWCEVGREAAIANIQHAYHGALGAAAARRIIRGCFRTQTCEEVETFFYPALAGDGVERFVGVEGREPDDNPLHEVVRRYGEAKVAVLERILGLPFIIAGKPGAMERVRSALDAGEVLYILLSVPPELARHRGRVRFLGHPAELPLGAEYIATESGAPLIPFTVHRDVRRLRHTLTIGTRVPGPEAGEGTLQRCVDVLEREIRVDPSQFFMWEYARSFWIDEPAAGPIDGRERNGYEANAHAS
jgi:hypothetical protein